MFVVNGGNSKILAPVTMMDSYPSGTVCPYKLFLLYPALVVVLDESNYEKVTNKQKVTRKVIGIGQFQPMESL